MQTVEYAIVDYARNILPARCRYMWDRIIGDKSADNHKEAFDVNVPEWVWDLTEDVKMDWDAGIFHLSGDVNGQHKYVKLVGVQFDKEVFERIWPGAASEPAPSATPTKMTTNAGRPRKAEWND